MSDLEPSILSELERMLPLPDGGRADWADVTRRAEAIPASSRQRRWRSTKPWRGQPVWAAARRRPLALTLAVVVVVSVATAATAWAILGSSAQETTSIECVIAGTDTIIPSTSGDPTADCAAQWQRDQGTAAPPLVAYDNAVGGVTVLPRSTKPPSGWKPLLSQDVALIQLQESLDDYISGLNSGCYNATAATALAEAKLAEFGFTGWSVTVRNSGSATASGAKACVSVNVVDPTTQTVTLIPFSGVATTLPPSRLGHENKLVAPQVRPGTTDTTPQQLADKLRPLTQTCQSLPTAVASVRAAASSLGLSESARTYQLDAVTDNSFHCASIYEAIGGTIFVTVRGPSS